MAGYRLNAGYSLHLDFSYLFNRFKLKWDSIRWQKPPLDCFVDSLLTIINSILVKFLKNINFVVAIENPHLQYEF